MSLLDTGDGGLLDADFDVYRPECWSSNLHNLTRMKAKERVVRIAKNAENALSDLGVKLESSSEIPSVWNGREVRDQWAFWVRDKDAARTLQPLLASRLDLATRVKAPADHYKHALVCIRLDYEAVEVGIRISQYATIDLANMIGRSGAEEELFAAKLSELPDGITLDGAPVSGQALVAGARALLSGEREWLFLGARIEREEALALGADLPSRLAEYVSAVAPIFEFCLWTEQNDHVGVSQELDAFAEQARARAESAAVERTNKAEAHAERAEKARARTSAKVDAEEAWRRMQAKRRASIPPAAAAEEKDGQTGRSSKEGRRSRDDSRGARTSGRGRPKPTTPAAKSARSEKRERSAPQRSRGKRGPAPSFEVGEQCRLTRGLLAGKEGEIRGEDKPGYYAVKVGVLEVKVSAHELEKIN